MPLWIKKGAAVLSWILTWHYLYLCLCLDYVVVIIFPLQNISTGSSCGVYHHNRKNIYQAPLCSLSFLDLCCHHCQHFFLIGFAILGWGNFITREMDHDHDEHCQRIRHFYFQAVS